MGTHYDLPIALALLVAQNRVPADALRSTLAFGELGLDGRLRAVPGVLAAVVAARDHGLDRVIVPAANAAEATIVPGIEVHGSGSLAQCIADLRGESDSFVDLLAADEDLVDRGGGVVGPIGAGASTDLADVRGQHFGRWCLEVAAAGRHHVFFDGPPGAGKTMLAERYPRLLPDLDVMQAVEVTRIHSLAGLLSRDDPLVRRPPFQAPNHADTVPSVIGGGARLIRPGAISLAHHGVLFLDEALEFRPTVLDALRQPLESGQISIRRSDGAARFPARFQLILAANPCPCGQAFGSGQHCRCAAAVRRRYQERLSGPVRDRVDIWHTVLPVSRAEMRQACESSATTPAVAARVAGARERAAQRFQGLPMLTNGEVPTPEFRLRAPMGIDVVEPIEELVARGRLTLRGADRVCRLAWTVADLAGRAQPSGVDVLDAIHMRTNGVGGVGSTRRIEAVS